MRTTGNVKKDVKKDVKQVLTRKVKYPCGCQAEYKTEKGIVVKFCKEHK